MDEFDTSEFDPIDYINSHFPDEKSLINLDKTLSGLDTEIKELDESVLDTVREQSVAGHDASKYISEAKDGIGDLHSKIAEIRSVYRYILLLIRSTMIDDSRKLCFLKIKEDGPYVFG